MTLLYTVKETPEWAAKMTFSGKYITRVRISLKTI